MKGERVRHMEYKKGKSIAIDNYLEIEKIK